MKKICKRCGKIISHSQKCLCKSNINNKKIDPERRKFYSSYAWKKLRNSKVKEIPYCQRCWNKYKIITTNSLQGHHILSYKDYPDYCLDDLNITVLCATCNSQLGDSSVLDWEVSEEVRKYVEERRRV